jgi:hypothetical protein
VSESIKKAALVVVSSILDPWRERCAHYASLAPDEEVRFGVTPGEWVRPTVAHMITELDSR